MLKNKFAPITFKVGFLRAGLNEAVQQYVRWQHLILRIVSQQNMNGPLDVKLKSILPLDEEGERMLFTVTRSDWIAVFDNRPGGGISTNAVAVISEKLNTLAIAVTEVPNTFKQSNPPRQKGIWGAFALSAFGRQESTGIWGVTRSVSLRNDVSGWKFEQLGEPWDFEDLERYRRRTPSEKLDSGLLHSYLEHLGIHFTDASFYDGEAVATRARFPVSFRPKTFDVEEIQHQMRIDHE